MSGVKYVSKHEEASGGGGSFQQQGSLIAKQNLANRPSKTTSCAICINLTRVVLPRPRVVLNKQICYHKRQSESWD